MPEFLVTRFGETGAKIVAGLLAFALVAAILALAYCSGKHHGQDQATIGEQQRTIDTQKRVGNANDAAAAARTDDAVRQEQQGQELQNATGNGSDTTREQRGCVILRQQGRNTSGIPACRGS